VKPKGSVMIMRKIYLLLIVSLFILLIGCSNSVILPPVYEAPKIQNLPDCPEFLKDIESLITPSKICSYMSTNMNYEYNSEYPDPYNFWITKKGDCDDHSTFATLVADYYGYETYQILIAGVFPQVSDDLRSHMIAVYVEEGKLTYSSNDNYYPVYYTNVEEIIEKEYRSEYFISWYVVYDIDMNITKTKIY
jgi:hypothetical protein